MSGQSPRGLCVLVGKYPSRRGEGGEERLGKKDTGYLYKALMVARRPLKGCRSAVSYQLTRNKRAVDVQQWKESGESGTHPIQWDGLVRRAITS